MVKVTSWIAACALACASASSALASFTLGGVGFAVTSSAGSANATFSGTPSGAGTWAWTGNWASNGASVSWTGLPVSWNGSALSMAGNFVIRNQTASTQSFVIDIVLPGNMASGTQWLVGGSAAFSMVNLNVEAGRIWSNGPMWTAGFDSATVGSLFTNASGSVDPFQTGALPSQQFGGNPIPGQPYTGGLSTGARVRLNVNLTAGMEATVTSVFAAQVVPAPGALALLALAAGCQRRRRR